MNQSESPSVVLRPLARAAMGLLLAGVDVYTVGSLLIVALGAISGERWWPLTLLTNLLPWLLLPALPLVVILTLARRWQRMALAGALALIFVALYGGLFLPNPRPTSVCAAPDGGCQRLRVMTYNALGNDYPDLDAQIRLLRESGADIVALQEVSPRLAEAIQRELAEDYPYRALYPLGIPGTGLLSRYPILEEEAFQFETSLLYHLRATLDVNGRPLTVLNAHPAPPILIGYTSRATGDILALADLAAHSPSTLLLGDFNASDLSRDYALLRDAGLTDAYRQAGWGLGVTFPARLGVQEVFPPLVRIDYIWLTPEFRAVRAWVGPDAGSDHLPVLAEIEWTPD